MNRRKFLRSLPVSSVAIAGCTEQDVAKLEHHARLGWNEEVIKGQPTNEPGTWAWLEFTTDPSRVKRLVNWDKMLSRLGMDAPPANNFYKFEEGERCFVVVVAHHEQPGHTLVSVDESDSDMFTTGELDVSFVEDTHDYHFDYFYDFTLWDADVEAKSISAKL
jgi:hypothetical protein